jgi:arylsulfatase A-like enzyme
MVLDECIGALSAALVDFELKESTLVLLTAPQGYALGEHGAVGEAATALYGERVHVPCLLRFPGAPAPPARRTHLVQTRDLYATLLHAAGAGDFMSAGYDLLSSEAAAGREFVVCTGGNGEAVIRTPAWMLRRAPREASDHRYAQPVVDPAVELYFKPDDRWEANEIASRAPDAAERLLAALGSAVRAGDSQAGPAALDDDLVAHPR